MALQYDYYKVEVPSDFSTNPEERANVAIDEAREKTRIYAMPAIWRVVSDDGETITVCRIRNRTRKQGKDSL